MIAIPEIHIHTQDEDFGSSPLGVACKNNHLEVVKTLIDNGAMVNYRDKVCFDFHNSYGYLLIMITCTGWLDRSY